jgi:hypothetical protein
MARERRWVILGEDGRHVSIGRATDPSEAEIEAAGKSFEQTGMGGWLAVMEGVYYSRPGRVTLMMVREIARPAGAWDDAVTAFEKFRRKAIAPSIGSVTNGPQ